MNGKKYYFDNDSKAVTGWQTIDGKKYYFNLNTAEAATGWQTIDGKKYYFNTNTSIAQLVIQLLMVNIFILILMVLCR
ncbi:WW domain protein [Clostridioides difficile P68]|nr:WW domain protein [Clostridioides difficile P68]